MTLEDPGTLRAESTPEPIRKNPDQEKQLPITTNKTKSNMEGASKIQDSLKEKLGSPELT